MQPIEDLNNLYYFARVVDYGSYTAAAEALGLQTSKLSRRISALETELGVRLLNRSTRKLSLTEAGKTFHSHCIALIAEAQAAKDAINETLTSPHGLVRVSCPTGLLQGGLSAIFSRYLAAHPQVRIALDATNRRVDVVEEGIDIAIRVRVPPLEDSGLAMRVFGPADQLLVASPDLIGKFGEPTSLEDIKHMPTISMANPSGKYSWHFVDEHGEPTALEHYPRFATDDIFSLRESALQGIGVAFLPKLFLTEDLESGRLRHLLPTFTSPSGVLHAVFPSRRGMIPAVRTLLDFLAANLVCES